MFGRVGFEFFYARGAAEVVILSIVFVDMFRGDRVHTHPADWVAFGGRGLVGRFCEHTERRAGLVRRNKEKLYSF